MRLPFRLCLSAACASLTLGCATSPPSRTAEISQENLVGKWVLTRVGSRSVERAISLDFRGDGMLWGSYRCNSMSGRYQIEPARIIFSDDVIITLASCPVDWPDNERLADIASRKIFSTPQSQWSMPEGSDRLHVLGDPILIFERDD